MVEIGGLGMQYTSARSPFMCKLSKRDGSVVFLVFSLTPSIIILSLPLFKDGVMIIIVLYFILRNKKMQVRYAKWNVVELYKRNLATRWIQTIVNKLL